MQIGQINDPTVYLVQYDLDLHKLQKTCIQCSCESSFNPFPNDKF